MSTLFLTCPRGQQGRELQAADLEIAPDTTFGGLAAEGGSWFGILVMLASLAVLGSVTTLLLKPGEVGRFLGADGAMFAAVVMLTTPLGFLVMRESSLTTTYSDGSGPLVAALGGLLAVVGATLWLFDSPYTARTPLKPRVNRARVVIAGFCVLWGVPFWSRCLDLRSATRHRHHPGNSGALDDVIERAELPPDDPNYLSAAEAGAEIGRLNASARQDETIYDNFNNDGPGLGIYAILLAAVGFLASLPAAGVFGLDEQKRWRWSVVVAGLGIGMLALAGAFVISIFRVADPNFVSGAERSCTSQQVRLCWTSRSTMAEFRRARAFAGEAQQSDDLAHAPDEEALAPA